MHGSLEEAVTKNAHVVHTQRSANWLLIVGAVVAAAVVVGAIAFSHAWPFTEANIVRQLEEATSSHVEIGAFHRMYFPHPGCIADAVVFRRGSDPQKQSVMHVERITIVGNLVGLFPKHLALIDLRGAHATFPPYGTGEGWKPTESKIVVDKLIANDALLEFLSRARNGKPTQFPIHAFVAHDLASGDAMKFEVRLANPVPPGEIKAEGSFGPWKMDQLGETPVSGNYEFRRADLGVFGGIGGTLSSNAKFDGTLESITVEGSTATPDFGVRGSSHQVDLKTNFNAEVDPANGDVTLHATSAHLRQTTVITQGTIAGHPDADGKRAVLEFAVHNGKIQDLLLLFVADKKSPLTGSVSLKANTVIPPGDEPFLKKLKIKGDFGIDEVLFSKGETQDSVGKLSASARGKVNEEVDPESVVSNLQGQVTVQNGVANFSKLSFRVPGALANLHGTFDLITEKIDLHGTLIMEATLPRATSGVKSFLLKAIDPFLKKNRHGGAKFPVGITGTYQKPEYRADPI
jgi:AsmA-like C-terminal region